MIIVQKMLINEADPNVVRKKKVRSNRGKAIVAKKLQKQAILLKNSLFLVVGVQGLEPWASCSQTYREYFFRLFIAVFSRFLFVLLTL